MTCIAALIDSNGVGHIASDSIGSNGHTKTGWKNKKIFRKGNLLIGYTSSYRMGQLLEHSLNLPARKVEQDITNYMYVDVVNAIRQVMKDNGYLRIDSNQESLGTFLILTEGRLFKLQDDLALLESGDNFDACGSGQDYALATMNTLLTHTKLAPKRVLTEAIKTAERFVTTVGGDVQYLSDAPKKGEVHS